MFAEAVSSLFSSTRTVFSNATPENPRFDLNDPNAWAQLLAGYESASGQKVTHENSLNISAVWQAVSLISGDVAKLPLYPYKRLADDDREIADTHLAYQGVSVQANPYKSAWDFWRDFEVHDCIWNNAYAYITRGKNGLELYNLLPDRTAPEWTRIDDGRVELIYVTEAGGELKTLMPFEVLHVRGISLDGISGCDITKHARDSWGLALAAQSFQSKFFKNGARIGGVLELPAAMNKPAQDKVAEGFRGHYEGGDNPFKTVILRDNAKFHAGQFSPEQALVTDVSDQQKREVANFFNIPPSKLGIRDSVSYNSFEQDNLSYLNGCLHHRTGAIAAQCNLKLLTEQERRKDTHYFEHNYSKFVQADWKTLNEGLEIMRRNEIINANEWRRKLNMNKRKDKGGEDYVNPNTKSAASQDVAKPTPPVKPKPKNIHHDWVTDTLNRMARRVGQDARREAKDSKRFVAWLENGYRDHCKTFDEAMSAAVQSLGKEDMANQFRGAFFSEMQAALGKLLDAPYRECDLASNVDQQMTQFERTAGERIATLLLKESTDE